ncbi:MAG: VIT1/CCC1 transporter family protein [Methanomassiliicoccales archaeon]
MANLGKGMFKKALKMPETWPALRRYFVNTIFDTTFVILGVIIGSALSPHPSIDVVKTTIITSAVALAISTGASVYEAESLEQSRRLDEISRAMLSSVDETDLGKTSRASIILIALVNSCAPLIAGAVTLTPFLVLPANDIVTAAEISITLAISILFVTGFFMGQVANKNPWAKGLRMAVIGLIAFGICYVIGAVV